MSHNMIMTEAPRLVTTAEIQPCSMMGMQIVPRIRAEDTGGAYSMIEQIVQPGAGSPPHICHRENKAIYIIEGRFAILLGQETVPASSGDTAFIPAGTAHSLKNIGTSVGRVMVSLAPGGHETFLCEMSEIAQHGAPDRYEMAGICKRHHVEMLSGA